MSAFCGWDISYAGCSEPPALPDDPTPDDLRTFADKETFEQVAAELLWNWTGRVFGICDVTIRPCRSECEPLDLNTYYGGIPGVGGTGFIPALVGGKWYNLRCGNCLKTPCNCHLTNTTTSILLPGPVQEIVEVVIDGETLSPDNYRLESKRALIRTDGGFWPECQDLRNEKDAEGSWYVTMKRGVPVPVGGQIAAGTLAAELYKAACKDNTCQLPQRVQSVTRQGVSIAVLDDFEDVQEGRTGIWSVDAWVASVNAPQRRSSRVYSPDVPRR